MMSSPLKSLVLTTFYLLINVSTQAQFPELIYVKVLPGYHSNFFVLPDDSSYVWYRHATGQEFDASIFAEDEVYEVNPDLSRSVIMYNSELSVIDDFQMNGSLTPGFAIKRSGASFIFNTFTGLESPTSVFESTPELSGYDYPLFIYGFTNVLMYNSDSNELEMPFHCLQALENEEPPFQYYSDYANVPGHYNQRAAWLSDGHVVLVLNMRSYLQLNWGQEFELGDSDWNSVWVKIDPFTGEYEAVPMLSQNGTALTYSTFSSESGESLYRTGVVRGHGVQMSPDGTVWETFEGDSLFYSFLIKENSEGEQDWMIPLFGYNNTAEDGTFSLDAVVESYNAEEIDENLFLSQFYRLRSRPGDTIYYNDFMGEEDYYSYPETFEPTPNFGYIGKSADRIYKINPDGEIESTFSYPLRNPDPAHPSNLLSEQPPHMFKIDDKLGWTQSYWANQDTTLYFIRKQNGGIVDSAGVDLPAGRGLFILWLNENFDLLEVTNIPFSTGGNPFNSGLSVNSISKFHNDTLLITGNITPGTTTNLDPFGAAEEVTYDEGQNFLAFYTLPEVLTDVNETSKMKREFSVYPNPASDELHLRTNFSTESNFVIHDLSGRKILSGTVPPHRRNLAVDIQNLQSGLYIIRVRSEEGELSAKFVVER